MRRRTRPNSPEEVVRLLVMVNRLRHRYHRGHSRVRRAITEFIEATVDFLGRRERTAFRIVLRDGHLTHDGTLVFDGDASIDELARIMMGLDCGGIVFRPDLTSASLNALLDWLGGNRERPADGASAGIEFIGASPLDRAASARAPFGLSELNTACQIAAATRFTLAQIFAELRKGHPLDVTQVNQLVHWIVDRIKTEGRTIAAPVFLSPSDDSAEGHATHVFLLSMALLHPYARDERELEGFCISALLHDIGLATVPSDAEVDSHTSLGAEILLRSSGVPPLAVEVAFTHHMLDIAVEQSAVRQPVEPGPVSDAIHIADRIERLTGRGTAHRATSFVDALGALMSEPSLKSKRDVIQAFLADLTQHPPGSLVRVHSGAVGVVLHVNPDTPDRPRIGLVQEGNGRNLDAPIVIDLQEDHDENQAIAETLLRPPYPLRAEA